MQNNETLPLFLSFLKIGAFTFGGGYAMLPLIQQEVIKDGWLSLSYEEGKSYYNDMCVSRIRDNCENGYLMAVKKCLTGDG